MLFIRYLDAFRQNPGRIVFYSTLDQSPESFFEMGIQDKENRKDFYPDADEL